MKFNEYQKLAQQTSIKGSSISDNVLDPEVVRYLLGLSGEVGEIHEKFKKIIRDNEAKITQNDVGEITKELGDVLWYLSGLCDKLGIKLEDVARANIAKLQSRKSRGKLGGDGDNR